MSDKTEILWATHTFNPVRGCEKISPGCAHCYAAAFARRNPGTMGQWGRGGVRVTGVPSYWKRPLHWNRLAVSHPCQCPACGDRLPPSTPCSCGCSIAPVTIPPVAFCASMGDIFEDWKGRIHIPDKTNPAGHSVAWFNSTDGFVKYSSAMMQPENRSTIADMARVRLQTFLLINATPNLRWFLLTKRPENIAGILNPLWHPSAMPANLWLGTSVESADYTHRIANLMAVHASGYFLSVEPMLGPVTLPESFTASTAPRLVICGGESGPHARPMHPDWARSIRDQCARHNIPFMFKQWGEWLPVNQLPDTEIDPDDWNHMTPHYWTNTGGNSHSTMVSRRCGKKSTGRLLDGTLHNGLLPSFPSVPSV